MLAKCFYCGKGTDQNWTEAAKWYGRASVNGGVKAEKKLKEAFDGRDPKQVNLYILLNPLEIYKG